MVSNRKISWDVSGRRWVLLMEVPLSEWVNRKVIRVPPFVFDPDVSIPSFPRPGKVFPIASKNTSTGIQKRLEENGYA